MPLVEVVDRLGGLDQRLRLRVGGLARIGQRRELIAVLLEVLDRRLVGDRQRDHVAAFFGLADLPVARARRHFGELLVVAMNVLRVGQLAGLADDAAEELERRRHGVGRRQVIDELGRDPRILQGLLDLRGVLLVDLLGAPALTGRSRPAAPAAIDRDDAPAITFFILPPNSSIVQN